jgi:UDP-N-acetylmuramate-alanine ligase
VSEVAATLADGDLVLSLGAGNINKIMERIANEYQNIRDKK